MSRFRIGMRVRIKYSYRWPELAGTEGTVVSGEYWVQRDTPAASGELAWMAYDVAPDSWGSHFSPDGDSSFAPRSEALEPATDSYDVTTWDSCVWQPEHLRVVV